MDTKKYIIEIPDNTAWIQWVKVSDKDGHVCFDFKDPEDLTLYTGPDLDAVKKEVRDKCMSEAEDLAYKLYSPKIDEAYQRGLNDAWGYAKLVALSEEDGGINWEKKKKLFNTTNYGIIKSFSINEVIEKLCECMQEEDFKVGCEVINDEDVRGVTVDMDYYLLHVLDENGVVQAWPREDAVKTGRYFPEIAEVLRKMRKEKE